MIFDLGGTLSHSAAMSEYANAAGKIAALCSAPIEKFVELWFAQSGGLVTGLHNSFGQYTGFICERMGLRVPESTFKLADEILLSVLYEYIARSREGAIEVLSYLKTAGYKTGLITDCAPDVPEHWEEMPFCRFIDVAVFSCSVGMNKADPRIFQITTEKLAVNPDKCIYIADGMRNELSNAEKLGMRSIQLFISDEIYESPIREDWQGQKISSLKEIINLLK